MAKTNKPVRRPAGIPLSISLNPRPNDGNDLASDIFKAVKNEEGSEPKIEPKQVEKTKNKIFPETRLKIEKPGPEKKKKDQVNPVSIINSVVSKDPLERLFEKSKAKELFDILVNLTHKSETPTDKVRVPRSYLMAHTNIKTRITLDQNLKRLEKLGLIKITSIIGEQEGNLYQVNLPENLNL